MVRWSSSHVEPPSKRRKKVAKYLERFGVPGVSLLGLIVLASQITAPTLISLGAKPGRVYIWIGISIVVWGILFGFFGEVVSTWALR
ncbi:hypothetical protein [Corynebacterium sp.]|uniref:hypothetical protein n=1 Tax=Corynebacterium sp. TaxID=1720 RepID=UPI0028AA0FCF|nr:hypothetical protein [Corynebacterium sp.]